MKIIIPGRLAGANEYILKCRTDRVGAATFKAKQEQIVQAAVLDCLHHKPTPFEKPVVLQYLWVEPGMQRDKDNIAFAHKFIQDAFVKIGLLAGDGWRYVVGFTDDFAVDKANPRIEVVIEEVEGECLVPKQKRSSSRGAKPRGK